LTREAKINPAAFASLSGRLDAIASMRTEAKDLTDMERLQAKKVFIFLSIFLLHALINLQAKDADKAAGEDMRKAMMRTRQGTKRRKESNPPADDMVADKENNSLAPTPPSGAELEASSSVFTSASSKRRCTRPAPRSSRANEMLAYMRESEVKAERFREDVIKMQRESIAATMDLQREAMTAQTTFQTALLQMLERTLKDA
jgi:hypothetical protein